MLGDSAVGDLSNPGSDHRARLNSSTRQAQKCSKPGRRPKAPEPGTHQKVASMIKGRHWDWKGIGVTYTWTTLWWC